MKRDANSINVKDVESLFFMTIMNFGTLRTVVMIIRNWLKMEFYVRFVMREVRKI